MYLLNAKILWPHYWLLSGPMHCWPSEGKFWISRARITFSLQINRWKSRVTITIRHLCSPSIFDVTPLCIINNIAISVTHGQQLWRVMIQMIPMSEPWLLKTTSPTGLSQPCGPALSLNGLWKHNTKQILANLSARALSILSNILNIDRITI